MFLASFLIGLREGLEAALIVGILVAFVRRRGRTDVLAKIAWGVGSATVAALLLGALFTYGSYSLSFTGQEIVGGIMSLIAVTMVTWMVFWMITAGRRMKTDLESEAGAALALGTGWAIFWIAFVSVGREGIETTLMLWGWATQIEALTGALVGILAAVGLGYLVYRGLVRFNLGSFFSLTGIVLVVVAAGILAYGIHDLQEAAVLPGPFSGPPITPTDLRTGDVLVGLTDGPFWMASFPFGWAFDASATIDPSGWLATLAKGTIGLTPQMSWLELLAWAAYLAIVVPLFLSRARRPVHSPASTQATGTQATDAQATDAQATDASITSTPATSTPTAKTPRPVPTPDPSSPTAVPPSSLERTSS